MSKHISLNGKLLIAMPSIEGDDFAKSVVFLCAHSEDGAMGLVINKPAPRMVFADLVEKMKLDETSTEILQLPVMLGGPVKQFQGFVLHSTDYHSDETLKVGTDYALTATVDVLQAIADGKGPSRKILALGYAGWSPGQLESEIMHNGWLHCDADPGLVFGTPREALHEAALHKLGASSAMLSTEAGRA
ncbi:YqgE/AlgH family protein [Aestuariivirga litoralis]|uniref:YqgE/AlgH family protein n=1 Tax=Aestuariivirga litoralis TaxID=2650924 RepID=UPI0018C6787A|nr:YqgE/AlgH family protein [Aestuariivirga litoralis]MBG1233383.1 YqgE/AlgH family protein [Aestuariivirga litoralis]